MVEAIRQRLAPDETVYALAPVTFDGRQLMLVIAEDRILIPGYGPTFGLKTAMLHTDKNEVFLNSSAGKMRVGLNSAEANHLEAGLAPARAAARRAGTTRWQRTGRAVGFAFIGVVVTVLGFGIFTALAPVMEGTAVTAGSDYEPMTDTELAANACEERIKEGLKAPSSAQFDHKFGDRSNTLMSDTINVDAQNGFGAMLRSRHLCLLEKNPDSDYFTVKDVIPLPKYGS